MIRMSQVKQKMFIGMAIGFAVGLVLLVISIVWSSLTIESYKNGTKYTETMKGVMALKYDVVIGQTITKDMLKYVDVHQNFVNDEVFAKSIGKDPTKELVGKTAKYNIPKNVPITRSMVTDELVIAQDVRLLELNTVLLPSDINEKEYIDIRIMFPNGEDYIVASQKEVNKIVNETMWINASEEEIMLINSAIVDSYLTEGTKLYAIKYADPSSQVKSSLETSEKEEAKLREDIRNKIYDTIGEIQYSDMDTAIDKVFDLAKEYRNYVVNYTKTEVNYQPNADVISQMTANRKVILEKAIDRLSKEVRGSLERRLKDYKINNEDDIGRVVSGAQESITNQKDLRKSILEQLAEE